LPRPPLSAVLPTDAIVGLAAGQLVEQGTYHQLWQQLLPATEAVPA
jgi:ABC-type transport system involved in Fe-S cluster assembly fused permease/ATPase subunit